MVYIRPTQWNIAELNAGARDEGFKSWAELKASTDTEAQTISDRILRNIRRNKGKYVIPLTPAEINRLTKTKHTWASVTKEYPDFAKGMKEYLDTKTQRPDLKKINKLKISPEKKFNMMSGEQKQFILRYNKDQFQPFKNTLDVDGMGKLSNFKSFRDILSVDATRPYPTKNGVVVLDAAFYKLNRAKRLHEYLKNEGIEKVEKSSKGSQATRFKGRWKLTDKAIKEGKTFASILAAFPNLAGEPSTEYKSILAKISRNHPIYKDTQAGLRSLFNFVQDSVNSEMEALKPSALRKLVANNPQLLKQVTGRIEPMTGQVISSGIKGLNNLSNSDILTRARLVTEHNRPMRDYAFKYMDKDRLKVLAKNLRNIDADMTHNISLANQWYNNSLKETATRLAEVNQNNPKLLQTLNNEFKNMGQRFYVGDKFYGASLVRSPEYRTSVVDYWRSNLKGMGYDWDKYASQYKNLKHGTLDDVLNKTLKNPTALRQLGTFLGCPGTFKSYEEGGRVRLQTGGQGLAQCVDTKLKQPGAMEKLAALPEETSGPLGKLKNATRGFLGLLGRGGVRAAPYAAIAAVGAAAEPLVKQFRNDDPTTYMTDPDQQKGVLLSLVEAETPQVDEEILNWQYPGMVAGAAAAIPGSSAVYKARRKPFKTRAAMGPARAALGPVGKFLAGSFSPLAVAASLPVHIGAQVKGGAELEDIATDPFNWMGPAFASTGAKIATRGMPKTGILSKALRMGMSPGALRVLSRGGIYGLLASAGLKGYDIWQDSKYK